MTTATTQPHDTTTCRLGPDAGPCEMCAWANERKLTETEFITLAGPVLERVRADLNDGERLTAMEPPTFDDDWELAPLCHTRYVERATAEYWYHVGRQSRERELLTLQNADMREMLRVARERISR